MLKPINFFRVCLWFWEAYCAVSLFILSRSFIYPYFKKSGTWSCDVERACLSQKHSERRRGMGTSIASAGRSWRKMALNGVKAREWTVKLLMIQQMFAKRFAFVSNLQTTVYVVVGYYACGAPWHKMFLPFWESIESYPFPSVLYIYIRLVILRKYICNIICNISI